MKFQSAENYPIADAEMLLSLVLVYRKQDFLRITMHTRNTWK